MKSNNHLVSFDCSFTDTNLIGVDEVGRGCLAGDVYASAVHYSILPSSLLAAEVNDSKKLSPQKREMLAEEIKVLSNWSLGKATVEEIDQIGILNATFLAMKRAINQLNQKLNLLSKKNTLVLVDGNMLIRDFDFSQQFVKKGDATSFHIASASIVAKVTRDQYMNELSEQYPEYQWSKNKGYGTKKHTEVIKEIGITPYHRKLFVRKIYNFAQEK